MFYVYRFLNNFCVQTSIQTIVSNYRLILSITRLPIFIEKIFAASLCEEIFRRQQLLKENVINIKVAFETKN